MYVMDWYNFKQSSKTYHVNQSGNLYGSVLFPVFANQIALEYITFISKKWDSPLVIITLHRASCLTNNNIVLLRNSTI